jgi:NADH-quinone oxidoreductase subunit J
MQLALFWLFSILMLLFALGVVFLRNPVSSALSLVMSFIGLAALFITLDAFFIGVVQVLVYAGAVMVLFLFIIMLLNLRDEKTRRLNLAAMTGGALVLIGFVCLLFKVIFNKPGYDLPKPAVDVTATNDIVGVGMTLFHNYTLPFQVVGVLLLVATVGVVLLSKKELK